MSDLEFGDTIKGFTPGQKVFARYTLTRILGRGGMGVVWLARDDKLERDIALKFLPEIVVLDPKAIEELKREAKRNLDLTHPHIVRIHDFVDDARSAAIAMEYVDGSSLSKLSLAQPGGCFQPAQLEAWVRQLCGALDYAHHDARVVHRDLKPANLMIDGRGRLKVTDFGIARSIADSVSRVSAQAGSSGTPVYMSPQQMMGEKPAVTDDVYALGATLYELLTGKPPFYSGNILLQVQSKLPPPLTGRRAELGYSGEPIPPEWEQTIAACLAKEPKDRPQSAGEVAERLGLAAKGNTQRPTSNAERSSAEKVERGVPTRAEPVPRQGFPSKTPLYTSLAAAVLILGGLGWYFGIHAPGQQRLAAERAAEEKRLSEIARLENERKTEEANRLRTETERIEAETRARTERERREAERQANARGGIVVRTNPAGAEVRVGAIALEKSPLTMKEQKLGKYPVRVRMDGYEEWSGEVEVKENEFTDLNVTLVRSTGTLALTSGATGVTVTLQDAAGKNVHSLPLPLELNLPTGRYRALVKRAGWTDRSIDVEVAREQTSTRRVDYPGGSGEHWYLAATVDELKAAHEAGHLQAALWLGDRYYGGLVGGKVDYPETLRWYQAALERNAGGTAGRLAVLSGRYGEHITNDEGAFPLVRQAVQAGDPYGIWILHSWRLQHFDASLLPTVTDRQYTAALTRIRSDAEAGDPMAMMVLGTLYGTGGMGVEKNRQEQIRWLRSATAAGYIPAATTLGLILDSPDESSESVKQESLALLERSIEAGDSFAMTSMANRLLNKPNNTTVDKERGFNLYRRALEVGLRRAYAGLGHCYLNGIGVAQDKAKAAEYFRKGLAKGDTTSAANLAILHREGSGVTADQNEYFRLSKWAALRGSPNAMTNVGYCLHNGIAVSKDDTEALRWWRLAAEENESYAMYNLGLAYTEGWGVTVNLDQAVEWLKKSAKAGNKLAQDRLTSQNLTW